MDHSTVLNIGASADADMIDVAAQHAAEPDGTVGADLNVTDDHGTGSDEGVQVNFGKLTAVWEDDGGCRHSVRLAAIGISIQLANKSLRRSIRFRAINVTNRRVWRFGKWSHRSLYSHSPKLTLAVLEPLARFDAAVFLAFDDAGVAAEEQGLFQRAAKFGLEIGQGLGDAVLHGAGLAG
jgi:hypothetical protein